MSDRRLDGCEFGFFLGPLPVQRRDFRAMLRNLGDQELSRLGDEGRIGIGRRTEGRERIIGIGQRGAQASGIQLCGKQVALQVIDFALEDGRIKLDQYIAGIDVLTIRNVNGTNYAGLERLDDLAVAGRNDLARCRRDDVHVAQAGPGQRQQKQRHKRRADRTSDGRWRRLDDFQGSGQETSSSRSARPGRAGNGNHHLLLGFTTFFLRLTSNLYR